MLNSSHCKLDRIVETIEAIIKLQHTSIKEKLEKSKIKMSHRLNNIRMFSILKYQVSSHGLKKIFGELERLNSLDQVTADNCGCQLRTSCGLPCAHELHFYMTEDLFIPLNHIDVFWRTLDIPNVTTEEVDEEVTCDAEIEKFKKSFADQPKAGKFSLLRKIKSIFDSSTKVDEPAVHKNIRGRPSLKSSKNKQVLSDQAPQQKESRRHSCSMYRPEFEVSEPPRHSEYVYRDLPSHFDLNDEPLKDNDYVYREPASMVNDFFDQDEFMQNIINYQPLPMQVPENSCQYGYNYHEPSQHDEFYYERPQIQEPMRYQHPLIYEIPSFFQPYVTHIEDVMGDGNCGFRSVAVAIGRHQSEWPVIRHELLEELHENETEYKKIYGDEYKRLEESINYHGSGFAPQKHWMWLPNTGLLIANKYKCILYVLSTARSATYFPVWTKPRSFEQNQSITIAFIQNNHFVKVDLEEGHPMPGVAGFYKRSKKSKKKPSEWEEMYKERLLVYRQAHRNVDLNVEHNILE